MMAMMNDGLDKLGASPLLICGVRLCQAVDMRPNGLRSSFRSVCGDDVIVTPPAQAVLTAQLFHLQLLETTSS